MYDTNLMLCLGHQFMCIRASLLDVTNHLDSMEDEEWMDNEVKRIKSCIAKMKKLLSEYNQEETNIRDMDYLRNYFDELGESYSYYKRNLTRYCNQIDKGRQRIFDLVVEYGLNLASDFIEKGEYAQAYDCIDTLHVFPDLAKYEKVVDYNAIWKSYIKSFRKKWGKQYFLEFKQEFRVKI